MRIDGSSPFSRNVMIGTTTTSLYKLHVEGSAYFKGIINDGQLTNSGAVLVGATTSSYKLHVEGSLYCTSVYCSGSLWANSANASVKAFCIPSPEKPGCRIRHRCLEGERSQTFYTMRLTLQAGTNVSDLPEYFCRLNADDAMVYISA